MPPHSEVGPPPGSLSSHPSPVQKNRSSSGPGSSPGSRQQLLHRGGQLNPKTGCCPCTPHQAKGGGAGAAGCLGPLLRLGTRRCVTLSHVGLGIPNRAGPQAPVGVSLRPQPLLTPLSPRVPGAGLGAGPVPPSLHLLLMTLAGFLAARSLLRQQEQNQSGCLLGLQTNQRTHSRRRGTDGAPPAPQKSFPESRWGWGFGSAASLPQAAAGKRGTGRFSTLGSAPPLFTPPSTLKGP